MKLNMKEKRPYERPQVTIVDMRVQPQLLQASLPGYGSESWSPEGSFIFEEQLPTL